MSPRDGLSQMTKDSSLSWSEIFPPLSPLLGRSREQGRAVTGHLNHDLIRGGDPIPRQSKIGVIMQQG